MKTGEDTGAVWVWEKEGAHHQGHLSNEGEDMGEETSWGPRRDRLGCAAAQLLQTLEQSASSAGTEGSGKILFINWHISILSQLEFSSQERKKEVMNLVSVVTKTRSRAYRAFWCFWESALKKESSFKTLAESMSQHSVNYFATFCLSTSICRMGI